MIKAEHIKKKYGSNTVLRDVSVHVKQGEIYGLIGKNGSGKTTLLRIITGQINDYDGTVSIDKTGNHEHKVSAVINHPSLFLNMSAYENLKGQAYLLGVKDEQQIERALRMVGLTVDDKKSVKNYSLGMTQRLKLAMALLENPDILILDEPLNGLDPDGIADLRNLLLDLNRNHGITILISSHILRELEQIAIRFGILHNGVIVRELSVLDASHDGKSMEELYLQYTRGGIQQ